ncbi:TetR/AcrR family transcriptional regulator [Nonomuraea longicatena]|uniref:TetR/AcrR family transcriptional regulator n=1 Tax=Nonomuraea longicatena TaxID=83682 RepID=A0ABP3YZW6_9ACTN
MARAGDTKTRIQETALRLFLTKGIQRTSLQDIADQLGITKPALYYHFASREVLVRSIVQPLIDDAEDRIAAMESAGNRGAREILADYFDFHHRHRHAYLLLVKELAALAEFGTVDRVFAWRQRVAALLLGAEPPPEQVIRSTVALGGLADCALVHGDVPAADLRRVGVDAAMDALGYTAT